MGCQVRERRMLKGGFSGLRLEPWIRPGTGARALPFSSCPEPLSHWPMVLLGGRPRPLADPMLYTLIALQSRPHPSGAQVLQPTGRGKIGCWEGPKAMGRMGKEREEGPIFPAGSNKGLPATVGLGMQCRQGSSLSHSLSSSGQGLSRYCRPHYDWEGSDRESS